MNTAAKEKSANATQAVAEPHRNRWARVPLCAVLAGGVAVSVVLCFALRALGREFAGVPAGLAPLQPAALLPAAILPVLGNGLGFYMSFRAKPSIYSTRVFLTVGVVMGLVGVEKSLTMLPDSVGGGSIITALAVALAPTLLTIPALLTLVTRSTAPRSR